MDPAPRTADPHAEYLRRRNVAHAERARCGRRMAWLGNLRFALALTAPVLLWLAFDRQLFAPYWLAVPVAVFVALSLRFELASRGARRADGATAYYDAGLARLEHRWAGRGTTGTAYLDPAHPYAADLDLFGPGSLFERLCTARTRVGRDTLAGWLTASAAADEVRARQGAVRELRDQPDWRERLALLGADVPDAADTAALAAWGAVPPVGRHPERAQQVALGCVVLTLLTAAGYWLDWWPLSVFILALFLQAGVAHWLRERVQRALDGLEGRAHDLFHLAGVLGLVERGRFTAAWLVRLQDSLRIAGEPPSRRLAELGRLLAWLDSRDNLYFKPIAPLLLVTTRTALAVEAWRRAAGPALGGWLAAVGELEAVASLAGYAFENPADPFPEIVEAGPLFDAAGLGHPLLPEDRCVRNDLRLDGELRLLVVSGSNMSGKSTFLRAAGVNAVLAQAGAPVRADRLRLSPLAVGATLRVQDSLQEGKSRFYAEISRLRKIVELTEGPLPVLFLLDEILHGTNSHDRRIGAAAVVRALLKRPAVGLVTTHDLALTEIAARLAPHAANVHFADEVTGGELHFDYRLRPGPVQHSNALALMRAVGLEVDSVE